MEQEKNHARRQPEQPAPEPKSPSALPGPNRQADIDRVGEALAPGTVPDEERKERERKNQGTDDGITRP